MRFVVLPVGGRVPRNARETLYLFTDNWDDWFKYSTQYYLSYIDPQGNEREIGQVKIGQTGQRERRPDIPEQFEVLGEQFFSLGQDPSYYAALDALGDHLREAVLKALRDLAFDRGIYLRAITEDVTLNSLLRSVRTSEVEGQLSRMAHGGVRLSEFHFDYTLPPEDGRYAKPVHLDFVVQPESNPPTNIHVIIGRNGVGKTTLLTHMTSALVESRSDPEQVGVFNIVGADEQRGFANLVSVAFSAFDQAEPLPASRNKSKETIRYTYVGLKIQRQPDEDRTVTTKSPAALSREFGRSVVECAAGPRLNRWRRALRALESDPIFAEANVAELADEDDVDLMKKQAQRLFKRLSSGHAIVLLTMTRLVESVEERTLVLLDEPEAHLHPPLLSAFVRALSDLLINRNGVALIATHSPVVLQEVPRQCVWKMRRFGRQVVAERPEIETFGENAGVLTREVFGLEVSQSGFHRLLQDAVETGLSYDAIIDRFDGALGSEARSLTQALVAVRNAEAGVS